MARTCTGSTSVARASVLAALVVLFAGCGGDAAAPERAAAIDRETFISTYVDLRTATIRAEGYELTPRDRAGILERHGISEDDLLAFVEVHGEDVAFMRTVWDEVEARLDAVRVLPSSDERR